MFLDDVCLTMNNSGVVNNSIGGLGGGIFAATGIASVTAVNATLAANSAGNSGAQLYWSSYGAIELANCSVFAGPSSSELVIVAIVGQVVVVNDSESESAVTGPSVTRRQWLRCPVGFNVAGAPYLSVYDAYVDWYLVKTVQLQTGSLGCVACPEFTYSLQAGSSSTGTLGSRSSWLTSEAKST